MRRVPLLLASLMTLVGSAAVGRAEPPAAATIVEAGLGLVVRVPLRGPGGVIGQVEALYRRPFEGSRALLAELGLPSRDLHPSWLFTPSMTAQRTLHGLDQNPDDPAFGTSAFWRDQLGASDVERVLEIARKAGIGIWNENGLSED